MILPVADIAARLRARGVATLVDGAHAPGAIPIDITALGVDWYVGNLHKWMWVPRSSGILWAAPERQARLHPPVVSWGLDEGFTTTFDLPGTRDPSPHLCGAGGHRACCVSGASRPSSATTTTSRGRRRSTSRAAGARRSKRPRTSSARWPRSRCQPRWASTREDALRLRDALLFEDGIEIPVHAYRGQLRARISAQVYNDMDDMERLASAVLARL